MLPAHLERQLSDLDQQELGPHAAALLAELRRAVRAGMPLTVLLLAATLSVGMREGSQFGMWQAGYPLVLMALFALLLKGAFGRSWNVAVTTGSCAGLGVGLLVLLAFRRFGVVGGMKSADPSARELLASVDASRWEVLWRLRLPSALPSILTTARFAIALALACSGFFLAPVFAERALIQVEHASEMGRFDWRRNLLFRDELAHGYTRATVKPPVERAVVAQTVVSIAAIASLAWRRREEDSEDAGQREGLALAWGLTAAT